MSDVTWPVAIIDVETSGMSRFSFPIEVGFARWRGLDAPIESWSTLIRPDYDWTCWSEEAGAIHGIARKDLKGGLVAREACRRLNAELFGCLVYCDGLAYDRVWLSQLYEAGNIKPTFQLGSMINNYHWGNPRMARWLGENEEVPHRAREDAVRLMRAFAYGLWHRPERIVLS